MKSLRNICNENIPNSLHSLLEASILDIENTIESGDTNAMFSLIISGDKDKIRAARNIIYNDVVDTQKQIRRKSTFKSDTLYIEFFVESKHDLGLWTDDTWGFRIGTCNPNKDEDDNYLDLIYALPTIHSNSENGAMTLRGSTFSTRYLRMDTYLKRPVYLLPEKYKDLFKKLFMYSFNHKSKEYNTKKDEFANRVIDTIKKL